MDKLIAKVISEKDNIANAIAAITDIYKFDATIVDDKIISVADIIDLFNSTNKVNIYGAIKPNSVKFHLESGNSVNISFPTLGMNPATANITYSYDGIKFTRFDWQKDSFTITASRPDLYVRGDMPENIHIGMASSGDGLFSMSGRIQDFYDCEYNSYPMQSFTSFAKDNKNIYSLKDFYIDGITTAPAGCFVQAFQNCTNLVYGPATIECETADESAFNNMFNACSNMQTAPKVLKCHSGGSRAFTAMFSHCSSLEEAPELDIYELSGENCCAGMFEHCTSLTYAPAIKVDYLPANACTGMFNNCTNIKTTGPILSTKIGNNALSGTYAYCTSLETAPALNFTELETSNNCGGMFYYCSKLKEIIIYCLDEKLALGHQGMAPKGYIVAPFMVRWNKNAGGPVVPTGWSVALPVINA